MATVGDGRGVLAIIAGTSLLQSDAFKTGLEEIVVSTDKGNVRLLKSTGDHSPYGRPIVFVQRHSADPAQTYTLPHLINHPAIALALKAVGVTTVVAMNSVGSLRETLPPGTILAPNDFFSPWRVAYVYGDHRSHLVPRYHPGARDALLALLREGGFAPVDKGTYVQTVGPRFETPAEVRFLSTIGDVVGMTGADEAVASQEVGLPYAAVCMIDNFGNGLTPADLTYKSFKDTVHANAVTVTSIARLIIDRFPGTFERN